MLSSNAFCNTYKKKFLIYLLINLNRLTISIKFTKNNSLDDSIQFDLIFDSTFKIESNCRF
jgi:hypothetical protein